MRVARHSGQEPGRVSRVRLTKEYPQEMQLAAWTTSRSPRARSDFSRCSRCPAMSFSGMETRSEISRAVAAPRRSSSRMASRTVRVRSMPEACRARRRCQSSRPQGLRDPARVDRDLGAAVARAHHQHVAAAKGAPRSDSAPSESARRRRRCCRASRAGAECGCSPWRSPAPPPSAARKASPASTPHSPARFGPPAWRAAALAGGGAHTPRGIRRRRLAAPTCRACAEWASPASPRERARYAAAAARNASAKPSRAESALSTTTAEKPCWVKTAATARPAGPAPMTATSCSTRAIIALSVGFRAGPCDALKRTGRRAPPRPPISASRPRAECRSAPAIRGGCRPRTRARSTGGRRAWSRCGGCRDAERLPASATPTPPCPPAAPR